MLDAEKRYKQTNAGGYGEDQPHAPQGIRKCTNDKLFHVLQLNRQIIQELPHCRVFVCPLVCHRGILGLTFNFCPGGVLEGGPAAPIHCPKERQNACVPDATDKAALDAPDWGAKASAE